MGNKSNPLSPPFTNKKKSDYYTNTYKIGSCEMQGWRNTMEDAKLIHLPINIINKDISEISYDEGESKLY